MKKLFNAIRHGELDEVKAILESHPDAVNEASTPPPKKDNMLSPLQVALKIGELDIAEYLLHHGADVNYIEPEEAEWRMPVLQDAIRAVFFAYERITADIEGAGKAAGIVRELLERGADPNVLSWKTVVRFDVAEKNPDVDAIGACVSGVYPFVSANGGSALERRDMAVESFHALMDLLFKHGADFEAWANRRAGAHHRPEETNRKCFIDAFVPVPDRTVEVIRRGYRTIPVGSKPIEPKKGDKRETLIIEGGIDHQAKMRAFMQEFCRKRGLLGIT